MSELLTAKKARELSMENLIETTEHELGVLITLIDGAIKEGKTKVIYNGTISKDVVNQLRGKDYVVEFPSDQREEPYVQIKW